MSTDPEFRLTGKHVAAMFGAFFLVVASVNGLFMYFGATTFPGLVVEDYYERGRDFNDTLKQAAEQNQLGWRSDATLVPQADGTTDLTLIMDQPAQKLPLEGLTITAIVKRTLHDKQDYVVTLEAIAPGVYAHTFDESLLGRWQIEIMAQNSQNQSYTMLHKVNVRP